APNGTGPPARRPPPPAPADVLPRRPGDRDRPHPRPRPRRAARDAHRRGAPAGRAGVDDRSPGRRRDGILRGLMAWLDAMFSTDAMVRIFDDRGRLQGMLDFEAALARAEARAGVIPQARAPPIGRRCRAELYDMDALARGAATAGNPAIPMVTALTVAVAADDADAARFVHFGATSQDAMDTGLM